MKNLHAIFASIIALLLFSGAVIGAYTYFAKAADHEALKAEYYIDIKRLEIDWNY